MVFRDLRMNRLEGCNPRSQARKVNTMLDMSQCDPPVNSPDCEQPVQSQGISRAQKPTHVVLNWRGGGTQTVQDFIGYDVVFAYVMSEGMIGIRNGDAVVLYPVHWSHSWGRA